MNQSQRDLQRISFITKEYRNLRGLTLVPAGLAFIAWGVLMAMGIDIVTEGFFLIILAIMSVLMWQVMRYYDHHFGRISISEGEKWRNAVVGISIIILFQFINYFGILLSASLAFFMAGSLNFYFAGPRRHAQVMALLLGAGGIVLLFNPQYPFALRPTALIFLGIMAIIQGLLDHRFLVKTLQPHKQA